MSHYSYRAIATCFLDGVENAEQATRLVVQAALANPALKSTIPDDLATDDSDDLFVEFEQYIKVNDLGQVIATIDTDEGFSSTEFFDYIASVLATIHTGDCLEVNWSGWDSREGISGGCDRYGRNGRVIEPASDAKALDKIAQILSIASWDEDGDTETLAAIVEVIKTTNRKINA